MNRPHVIIFIDIKMESTDVTFMLPIISEAYIRCDASWFHLCKNLQEARALLGRLEYQRGNVEGALRVFDGIDLQAAIQRLQPSFSERLHPRKGRSRIESLITVSQHAAGLVLEAIYLKAKSLQKLGRLTGTKLL